MGGLCQSYRERVSKLEERVAPFDSYSEEAWNSWQECNPELTTRRWTSVKMVRWIGNELQNLSMYDGTGTVEEFLDEMEFTVEEIK